MEEQLDRLQKQTAANTAAAAKANAKPQGQRYRGEWLIPARASIHGRAPSWSLASFLTHYRM